MSFTNSFNAVASGEKEAKKLSLRNGVIMAAQSSQNEDDNALSSSNQGGFSFHEASITSTKSQKRDIIKAKKFSELIRKLDKLNEFLEKVFEGLFSTGAKFFGKVATQAGWMAKRRRDQVEGIDGFVHLVASGQFFTFEQSYQKSLLEMYDMDIRDYLDENGEIDRDKLTNDLTQDKVEARKARWAQQAQKFENIEKIALEQKNIMEEATAALENGGPDAKEALEKALNVLEKYKLMAPLPENISEKDVNAVGAHAQASNARLTAIMEDPEKMIDVIMSFDQVYDSIRIEIQENDRNKAIAKFEYQADTLIEDKNIGDAERNQTITELFERLKDHEQLEGKQYKTDIEKIREQYKDFILDTPPSSPDPKGYSPV